MRNILYTRRKYEKINPAAFDKEATVLIMSTAENSLGESVVSYAAGDTIRVMFDKLNSSIEHLDESDTSKIMYNKGVLITWYNTDLLNSKNRVRIDGVDYNILDGAVAFARNRFTRCLLAAVE